MKSSELFKRPFFLTFFPSFIHIYIYVICVLQATSALNIKNKNIYFVLSSLIRTFDLRSEVLPFGFFSNKFGKSLTYSYLCSQNETDV